MILACPEVERDGPKTVALRLSVPYVNLLGDLDGPTERSRNGSAFARNSCRNRGYWRPGDFQRLFDLPCLVHDLNVVTIGVEDPGCVIVSNFAIAALASANGVEFRAPLPPPDGPISVISPIAFGLLTLLPVAIGTVGFGRSPDATGAGRQRSSCWVSASPRYRWVCRCRYRSIRSPQPCWSWATSSPVRRSSSPPGPRSASSQRQTAAPYRLSYVGDERRFASLPAHEARASSE
jgi:hypothetical protein